MKKMETLILVAAGLLIGLSAQANIRIYNMCKQSIGVYIHSDNTIVTGCKYDTSTFHINPNGDFRTYTAESQGHVGACKYRATVYATYNTPFPGWTRYGRTLSGSDTLKISGDDCKGLKKGG